MYLKSILEALHLKMGQWRGKYLRNIHPRKTPCCLELHGCSQIWLNFLSRAFNRRRERRITSVTTTMMKFFRMGLLVLTAMISIPKVMGMHQTFHTVPMSGLLPSSKIQKMRDFMVMKMTTCLATVVMKN